ncbi:MAG: hypothetical protein LBC76_00075 [Treponema sp.]|jgi:hypothetical protein|nr:hypothetical protein [Treponema sp.]
MKKQILLKIFFTFIILTFGSCSDPIFKTISQEEKQLEPHIKGSPTNFVVLNGNMYVGSGTTLYRYKGTNPSNPAIGRWDDIPNVGNNGNIRQLAATSTFMYLLCGESGRNVLRKSSNGNSWANVHVPDDILVQSVYAANNQLFIGTGNYSSYSIYEYDGNNFTFLINSKNMLLNGVAYDSNNSVFYLIAKDIDAETGNIFKYTAGSLPEQIPSSNPFMGIISLGNSIVAISRNGILCNIGPNISPGPRLNGDGSSDKLATGALEIWTDPNTSRKLLLAGRQDKMNYSVNYLQGYQELELENGKIKAGAAFRDPGLHSLSTVDNNASYKTNMEKNPVNYLYQDSSDHILFASTQTNGVWSYRLRGDRWLWNAEQ